MKRVALASFVGTTIEWYDFFLYGTAAALVNAVFYIYTVWVLTYATKELGVARSTILDAT